MPAVTEVRIAIHTEKAGCFGHRWIEHCQSLGIHYEIINGYRSDVIKELRRFDGFLWHFHHLVAVDLLIARHILTSAEYMGLKVFPNSATSWHFDDKLAQKYILEAIQAPIPATYVFYDKSSAVEWLHQAKYPLVWKLRRGAGSHNVRLVRDFPTAKSICQKAFRKGINPVPRYLTDVNMRARKIGSFSELCDKMRRFPQAYLARITQRQQAIRERGYIMFQQFMPNNKTDTRITIIGQRAFGYVRNVRKNDFRASGSGSIDYDRSLVDLECVKTSFLVSEALQTQSVALDFVKDSEGRSYITDVSYGYVPEAVNHTGGYWDRNLQWHEGNYWPEHLILDDLLESIYRQRTTNPHPPN